MSVILGQFLKVTALVSELLPCPVQILLQAGVPVDQIVVLGLEFLLKHLLLLQNAPEVLQVLLGSALEVALHNGICLDLLKLALVPRNEHLQALDLRLEGSVLRVELGEPPVLLCHLLLQFLDDSDQVELFPIRFRVQALLLAQEAADLVEPFFDAQARVNFRQVVLVCLSKLPIELLLALFDQSVPLSNAGGVPFDFHALLNRRLELALVGPFDFALVLFHGFDHFSKGLAGLSQSLHLLFVLEPSPELEEPEELVPDALEKVGLHLAQAVDLPRDLLKGRSVDPQRRVRDIFD